MATEVEERQQQDSPPEHHGDGVTHAFILEQMQRGFAEVNARMDAGFAQSNARMDAETNRLNSRIDRLAVVLIAGQFAIVASIIGVAVASFLLN